MQMNPSRNHCNNLLRLILREQTIFSDAELEEAGFTTNGNMFSPYDNGNSFDNSNNGFVSLIGSDGSSSSTAVASKKNDSSNNNSSLNFLAHLKHRKYG